MGDLAQIKAQNLFRGCRFSLVPPVFFVHRFGAGLVQTALKQAVSPFFYGLGITLVLAVPNATRGLCGRNSAVPASRVSFETETAFIHL